jgi:hypothetical protein
MSLILKPVAIHSIVGNAPYITSVAATAAPSTPRTFYGTGAPSSTTLAAGNGMYNAPKSGFVINASLAAAGSGYAVGNVLTTTGGTDSAAMEITVDMVNESGAILDFHISLAGDYSAYPALPAATTGAGTGATFNLNFPPPDYYVDVTTPTAPVLYMCMTAGSNSTSVWAAISGGASSSTALFIITSLTNADYFVGIQLASAIVSGSLVVSLVGGFVNIAKHNRLRPSVVTEIMDGVTLAYSEFTSDNYRVATDSGGNTEFQVAFPRYIAAATLGYSTSSFPLSGGTAATFLVSQCVLKCAQITGQSIVAGPTVCQWEEAAPRVWARQYNQAAEGD